MKSGHLITFLLRHNSEFGPNPNISILLDETKNEVLLGQLPPPRSAIDLVIDHIFVGILGTSAQKDFSCLR